MLKSQSLKNTIIFSLLHGLFFVLMLSVFRPIPGVDVAENFFWGKNLEWGYYKHPPLFAFISHIFALIFGASAFTNYLICGIFIFATFIAVFFLAKEFLPEEKAFLAVILLEGLSFAGINARTFNANLVQVPFWVLSCLFYVRGVKSKKMLDFGLFGVFLGLAFLGKYFALLLGLTIFLSFISVKETRNLLKTPLPYFAVFCFAVVIFPHIYWLFQNDFLPFQYIKSEQNPNCNFFACRKRAFDFVLISISSVLLMVLGFLYITKNRKIKTFNLQNFKENFLFFISILPFAITSVSSLVLGYFIVSKWGATMFFFMPIFLLYFVNFEFAKNLKKRLKIFVISCFAIWGLIIIGSGLNDLKTKGQHFAVMKKIAIKHTKNWEEEFKKPLKYVAGNTLDAGTFYLFNTQINVIPNKELKFTPYIQKDDVESDGILLLENCPNYTLCRNLSQNEEVRGNYEVKLKKHKTFIFVIYKKPLAN